MSKKHEPAYTPPANPEAEQSVLGAILVRPEVLDTVADLLTPADFYRGDHGRIFQAIIDLYVKKEPVDLVTVSALLKERGQLEVVGGPVFLAELSEQVGFATNAEYYARIVYEKAVLRRLLDCAQRIASGCLSPVEDLGQFLDQAESSIFQAVIRRQSPIHSLGEIIPSVMAQLEELYYQPGLAGIPTGFIDLDRYTGGLQKSDLIIVAGRPSMGKTALAMNIVYKAKVSTAFFSLEMSKEQLVHRVLAAKGEINATRLRMGRMDGAEWTRLEAASGTLMDHPIYIDETPGLTPLEIRARARRLKAAHDIKLVVVDYLQLMTNPAARSREDEIGGISGALKGLAKELKVPVIALSQLSRKCEERPNKRPVMSDLRDSGRIEQDADVIMFIYRDEVYREDSPDAGTAEVNIAKQRNGSLAKFKLTFQAEYSRFLNYTE